MASAALPIPDDDAYVEYASVTGTGPLAVPFPLPISVTGAVHVSVNNVELAATAFSFTPDSGTLSGYPTGTVTLVASVTAANVKIWRDTPMTRTLDYSQGPFDIGAFNAEVSRLVMEVQDNRLRIERSETTGSLQSRTVTPTGGTVSRTLADWMADVARGLRVLTSNETFYVNVATGNDTTGNGSLALPWATRQKAWDYIQENLDLDGDWVVTVRLTGTFTETFDAYGPITGNRGPQSVVFRGAADDSTTCIIAPSAAGRQGWYGRAGASFTYAYMSVGATGSAANGVLVDGPCWIEAGALVKYTACTRAKVSAAGAGARHSHSVSYTDSGAAAYHMLAENGAFMGATSGITCTTEATPAYSGSWVLADQGGSVNYTGIIYAGSGATGVRYIAESNGCIDPGAGGETFFPGSLPGVRRSGGAYLAGADPALGGEGRLNFPQGRLSLTSGVSVTVGSIVAATTVFYALDAGDVVPIRGALGTVHRVFAQLSLALDNNAGHAGYHQSGKNFDLFVFMDGETMKLGTGPAWTNDTTRADAVAKVRGLYVNTGSIVLRWGSGVSDTSTITANFATYVGTMRATADGQTENSFANCALWNMYNRRPRNLNITDTTDTWTYSTTAFRQANAATTNQLGMVRGFDEDAATAMAVAQVSNSTATVRPCYVAIGLDSTTTPAAIGANYQGQVGATSADFKQMWTRYSGYPGAGWHTLVWLEQGNATGGETQTWRGDAGAASIVRSGIAGEVMA